MWKIENAYIITNNYHSYVWIMCVCWLMNVCIEREEFFFFGCAHSMWKFPGQGLNLRHSSDPSCRSDNNAGSLTRCTAREILQVLFTQINNIYIMEQWN